MSVSLMGVQTPCECAGRDADHASPLLDGLTVDDM